MMNFILEMTLMGVFATLVMDLLAILFGKLRIIHPLIKPESVGRWVLYILKGRFIHTDINKSPELDHEKLATFISHYLIGIGLAGIYLLLEKAVPTIQDSLLFPVLYGISTVILPWFWLFTSFGLGFMASKTRKKSNYIVTSFVNHTSFGLGFAIWILLFRN